MTRISSRARQAPRQWCGPNFRGDVLVGLPADVEPERVEEDLSSKFAEMYHIVTLSPRGSALPRARCRPSPCGRSRERARRSAGSPRAQRESAADRRRAAQLLGMLGEELHRAREGLSRRLVAGDHEARRSSRTRGRSASRRRPRHGRSFQGRSSSGSSPALGCEGRAVLGQLDRGGLRKVRSRYSDVSSRSTTASSSRVGVGDHPVAELDELRRVLENPEDPDEHVDRVGRRELVHEVELAERKRGIDELPREVADEVLVGADRAPGVKNWLTIRRQRVCRPGRSRASTDARSSSG